MFVNKVFKENTTIELSDYQSATILSGTFRFTTLSERGLSQQIIEYDDNDETKPDNRVTITFVGKIPSSVVNMTGTFYISPNYIEFKKLENGEYVDGWDTLIEDCVNLETMYGCFTSCKLYGQDKYFTLNTDWFPGDQSTHVSDIILDWAFYNTPTFLDENFKFKNNVTSTYGTFSRSSCQGKTYEVSSIFALASKLKNATRCFANNTSVYTENTLTIPVVLINGSDYETFIPGLFYGCNNIYGEISGGKYKGYLTKENGDIINELYHPWSTGSHSGIFESCGVILNNNSTYEYISSRLDRLFMNSNITIKYKGEENETHYIKFIFNSKYINDIMYHSTITSDNKIIDVELKNTERASRAFEVTSSNSGYSFRPDQQEDEVYPIPLPNSIITADSMFKNQNITKLSINYFYSNNTMFNKLTSINGMFAGTRIKKLPYDVGHGFIPTSVTDMDYMFQGVSTLKGGIPNNFFNNNTNLTNLNYVFYNTLVLSECEDDNDKSKYGYLNISQQLPNVVNVSNLFFRNYPNVINPQPIDSKCFYNCTILSGIFLRTKQYLIYEYNNNRYIQNDKLELKNPVNLSKAFVGFNLKDLVIEDYSKLKNIESIFALVTTLGTSTPTDQKKEIIKNIIQNLLTIDPTLSTITYTSCMSKWERDSEDSFLKECLGQSYELFTSAQRDRFYQVDISIPNTL